MIHRIIPNLNVRDASAGHDFYIDFLGLEKQFDLGWIASFRSPENRSIQVSLVSGMLPRRRTRRSAWPLTTLMRPRQRLAGVATRSFTRLPISRGALGVLRRDPNGVVVNVAGHPD